ncbi:MAG: hypothetical protein JWR81_100, partial [Pseudonocardia sp.]|nr:hypothetical protein [Pseudonocardia sp.]
SPTSAVYGDVKGRPSTETPTALPVMRFAGVHGPSQ